MQFSQRFQGLLSDKCALIKTTFHFTCVLIIFGRALSKKIGFTAILIFDIFGHFTNARLLASGIWVPGQLDSKTETYTWIETPYINEHLVCVLESVRPTIRTLFSQKRVICRKNG